VACAIWTLRPSAGGSARKIPGKGLLTGKKLLELCIWHAGLDDRERRDWEERLSQLNPDVDLNAQLNAFSERSETFAKNPEDTEDDSSDHGWELLLSILEPDDSNQN
jgi:hypothetical protein